MLPGGAIARRYEQDMAIVRTPMQWVLLVLLGVLLFTLPLFIPFTLLRLITLCAIIIIAVHGLNIVTGHCGQISLGHAAFVVVGAYTTAILATTYDFPLWLCLPCAGLAAGVIGIIFGLPALRVKGFYLILATIAAQYIVSWSVTEFNNVTKGTMGIKVPVPQIGAVSLDSASSMYYLIIVAAIVATFLAKNLTRGNLGRMWTAIGDNDLSASLIGVNVFYHKLSAFFVGCFFAGIAGFFYAIYFGSVNPDMFSLMDSIWFLSALIIGGVGSTTGVIFGVLFMWFIKEGMFVYAGPMVDQVFNLGVSTSFILTNILFGIIIILFLIYEPRGLAHRWELFKVSYRLWPFSY